MKKIVSCFLNTAYIYLKRINVFFLQLKEDVLLFMKTQIISYFLQLVEVQALMGGDVVMEKCVMQK